MTQHNLPELPGRDYIMGVVEHIRRCKGTEFILSARLAQDVANWLDALSSQGAEEAIAWMHQAGHVQVRCSHWGAKTVASYTAEKGWTPLYTSPPPKSDEARDAERWRMADLINRESNLHPDSRKHQVALSAYRDAFKSGLDFCAAIDAALAAQQSKEQPK